MEHSVLSAMGFLRARWGAAGLGRERKQGSVEASSPRPSPPEERGQARLAARTIRELGFNRFIFSFWSSLGGAMESDSTLHYVLGDKPCRLVDKPDLFSMACHFLFFRGAKRRGEFVFFIHFNRAEHGPGNGGQHHPPLCIARKTMSVAGQAAISSKKVEDWVIWRTGGAHHRRSV